MRPIVSTTSQFHTQAELATKILDYKSTQSNTKGLLALQNGQLCLVSKKSFLFNFFAIRQASNVLQKAEIISTKNFFGTSFSQAFNGAEKSLGNPHQAELIRNAAQTIRNQKNDSMPYVICKDRKEALSQQATHIRMWPSKSTPNGIAMLFPRLSSPYLVKTQKEVHTQLNEHIRDNALLKNGWALLEQNKQSMITAERKWDAPKLTTYRDVRSNPATRIHPDLNANLIKTSKEQSVIAASYPTKEALPTYLNMLSQEKPAAIFILVEDQEISAKQLPFYFSALPTPNLDTEEDDIYQRISAPLSLKSDTSEADLYHTIPNVRTIDDIYVDISDSTIDAKEKEPHTLNQTTYADDSIVAESTPYAPLSFNGLDTNIYTLAITKNSSDTSDTTKMLAIHVTNWSDRSAGHGAMALKKLASYFDVCGDKILVHCKGGVGRTGTLIVAKMMLDESKKGGIVDYEKVLDFVAQVRKQRNTMMVQTEEQLKVLFELADLLRNETAI